MNKSIIISEKVRQQMSARSGLVGLGIQVKKLGILEPLEQQVKIVQKTVKYTPGEKLTDALIAILAGARGLVEVNKRVRSDPALQVAFGRTGCAEQSVIQETLDASNSKNVAEIEQVVDQIFRLHSQTYQHDFEQPLVLEVDMTGRPCGRKAAFASKGYFAKQRNRRGRQPTTGTGGQTSVRRYHPIAKSVAAVGGSGRENAGVDPGKTPQHYFAD